MKADFRYGLRGVAIALLSLLLLACSEPKLAYIGSNGKLLAFGDSLTQGVGAKAGQDYPSRLAELCRCEVINAGISGEQSAAGLERLPALLDETKPDLLILLEGGNDILRGRSQVQLAQNIEAMLLEAKARQIPVVLLAVPQKSLLLSPCLCMPNWPTSTAPSCWNRLCLSCCVQTSSSPILCISINRGIRVWHKSSLPGCRRRALFDATF
ncbi:GDSL-type esterase/lipase family protein [Shewanella algae]|uniref:GDSL-type esterase/lipase family protein n=1 Tax=Shewanella algae TaxID=38313 RepID=UPI00277B52B9|nr:GDSL-type esterase/lipase family protein [Shewanella algae]